MIEPLFLKVFSLLMENDGNRINKIYKRKYDINNSVNFNCDGIILYGKGEIIINKNSYADRPFRNQSSKGCEVAIGWSWKIGLVFSIWSATLDVYSY